MGTCTLQEFKYPADYADIAHSPISNDFCSDSTEYSSMTVTVTHVFKVVSIHNEDICLKTIEGGLTVFVENRKYFYDNITWNRVKDLSENDIKRITLESQNNMNTIWHIESVEDV